MKLTTYLENASQLEKYVAAGMDDFVLATEHLSRLGRLGLIETIELAKRCNELGVRPILEWDILMTENVFQATKDIFEMLPLELFASIRVQDPGAVNYLLERHPNLPIQLVLETGNHNLESVKTWCQLLGDRLARVVFSTELPKSIMGDYIAAMKELQVETELLGLGKILLFYSPRPLLSLQSKTESGPGRETWAVANGQETAHKGFKVLENRHGTFMFNTTDHCLLENMAELEAMGLDYFRVDLRAYPDCTLMPDIARLIKSFDQESVSEIKQAYPSRVIRGYYSQNKSDVLFEKLKNSRLARDRAGYLGDILEVKKDCYVAIHLRSGNYRLKLGDRLHLMTPEGHQKSLTVTQLKTATGETVVEGSGGDVLFLPPIQGIVAKTVAYLGEEFLNTRN